MKTAILVNRGSGRGVDRRALSDALHAAGITGDPQWLDGSAIAGAAEAAVADGAELVIAGGGDGTVSAVAGALAGSQAVLAILPLGTLNHFARDLGIPLDLADAAKLAAGGSVRTIDIAEVNGRRFINNSAIGIYPLMVRDREGQQRRLGRGKRAAMAVAALRTLFAFSSHRLTLTVAGHKSRIETPLLFVGNNAYKLEVPGAGTRERLDQGELSVLVFRRRSRLGFGVATMRALFGRERREDIIRLAHVRELRVDSARKRLAISVDGETVQMQAPLHYRIRPRALQVIA